MRMCIGMLDGAASRESCIATYPVLRRSALSDPVPFDSRITDLLPSQCDYSFILIVHVSRTRTSETEISRVHGMFALLYSPDVQCSSSPGSRVDRLETRCSYQWSRRRRGRVCKETELHSSRCIRFVGSFRKGCWKIEANQPSASIETVGVEAYKLVRCPSR